MINIQLATTKMDFERISELASIIWHDHYPAIISLKQIDYMLKNFNSTQAIIDQVAEAVLFYFIIFDGVSVGYMAIKKETDFVFIAKLYLMKGYRGKKLAKHVVEFIASVASSYGLNKIKLHVNKNNINAILAYEKMGFYKSKSMITAIGSGFVMDDFEMTRII